MGRGTSSGLANAAAAQASAWAANASPRLADVLAATAAAAAAAVTAALKGVAVKKSSKETPETASKATFKSGGSGTSTTVIPLPVALLALLEMADGGDAAAGGAQSHTLTPAEYFGAAGQGSVGVARRTPWWPAFAPVALAGAMNTPLLWDIAVQPGIELVRLVDARYAATVLSTLFTYPAVGAGIAAALGGRSPLIRDVVAWAQWPSAPLPIGLFVDVRLGPHRVRGVVSVDLCEALRGGAGVGTGAGAGASAPASPPRSASTLPWPLALATTLGAAHGFDGQMVQGAALALATALCDALVATAQGDVVALAALHTAAAIGPPLTVTGKQTRGSALKASANRDATAVSANRDATAVSVAPGLAAANAWAFAAIALAPADPVVDLVTAPLLRELVPSIPSDLIDAAAAACLEALAREPEKDMDDLNVQRVRIRAHSLLVPAVADAASFGSN